MNKVSFPISACLCLWAALLLPTPSLAQKSAAPKPAVQKPAASSLASAASLSLSPIEALSQKQMLADDKRLDRPFSLDVISVPLDEVLQKESVNKSHDTKTSTDANADAKPDAKPDPDKLALTASHNCEDLKLQIRLNHRPLRMLMTALAEMLPGTWTRTKEGYNLSLTDKAIIARAEWWRLFLGEREKALAAQRQAVLAAMGTKARRRQADDPEPEPSDHAVEEEMANQHDLFHTLPQTLKEQIAANMEETAFYEVQHVRYSSAGEYYGAVGWLSQMPPQTQEMFKTAMQDYITNHLAGAAFQKYASQAQNGLAAFDPSKVYFFFHNAGIAVDARPFNGPPLLNTQLELHLPPGLSLSQSLLMLDQSRLADFVYGGSLAGPHWKQLANTFLAKGDAASDIQKQLIYQVYGVGDAAPLAWKQLVDYQRGRVWPNTLPVLPRERGHPFQIGISQAAQTDWLGERGGMEYVCDYYSHGGSTMPAEQKKLPVKRPLATELDEMAAKRDISWKRTADGLVLIRNNRWYRDDDLEVPQPLLRRWFAVLLQSRQQEAAAQAAVPAVPQTPEERLALLKQTWDWAVEASSTLTPWQIFNGLSLFQPEEKDLAPQNDASAAKLFEPIKHQKQLGEMPPDFDFFTYMTRQPPFEDATSLSKYFSHTVHFYGSLDDAARTALLAGRLPASVLSPSQLTEAAPLLPLLPRAVQNYPPDAVLLRLPCPPSDGARTRFGAVGTTGLELVTPPPDDPQNAP